MGDPLISFENVAFGYVRDRPVLADVSLSVGSGECVALLGANGGGKTTLLHLAVGLLGPTAGRIVAFGRPRTREVDFLEVRRRAGLLFQDPEDQLFCPTVAEDVAFGPANLGFDHDEVHAVVDETLAALGLGDYARRITYKLSQGEKHLVALATVLAMRPEVLLLDEPSTNLDGRSRQRIVEILTARHEAMLLVTHDLDMVRTLCSRVAVLDGGRIITTGPTERILGDGELLRSVGIG